MRIVLGVAAFAVLFAGRTIWVGGSEQSSTSLSHQRGKLPSFPSSLKHDPCALPTPTARASGWIPHLSYCVFPVARDFSR